MAKRKSKANPRKVNIKKAEDENKKKEIRIKISGPKNTVATKSKGSNEDLLGNLPYRTRTRTGMERGGPSGSVAQSNSIVLRNEEQSIALRNEEQSSNISSLLLDKTIGEFLENQIGVNQIAVGVGEQTTTTDLGEFAKAIVRFQREAAQLQMNQRYNTNDGGVADSAIQGGESLTDRVNVEDDMARDDDAHADVDEDADVDAEAEADEDVEASADVDAEAAANVDAEAAANETERSINEEQLTEDYHEDDLEEQPKSQSGRKKRKGLDPAALPLLSEANNNSREVDQEQEQHLTEAYLEEDPESQPESQQGKKKRRGRGPTTLRHLHEFNTKTRKVVEYNENGQPMGRASVELASYMGTLARYMVPITYKTWRKVPNTLKEKLWSCLEERYVLDPRSRKILISGIGDKWRSFKCNLTLNHVLPFKDDTDFLVNPPAKYGFLKQEHWDEFVQSRLSKTFQDLHKAQSERRGTYLFPHLLGRRNYATLAEELKKSGEITPDEIDRSILWKKARQNKKGEYINDATREKAMIIDELKSKGTEGILVNDVKTDILTQALGTPEHSGRVRGVGQFVTPTAFFHTPRRGSSSYVQQLKEQHTLMESKWQEERVSRMKVEDRLKKTQDRVARLENQLGQLINQGSLPALNFENVCSNTSETSDSDNGKSTDDELLPADPKSGLAMVLGDAFQTFYTRASQILTGKRSSIPVLVDDAVFGTVIELFLDLDDIRYMCEMEDLSANCIMVYVKHLYDILVSNGMQDVYTFVNPAIISPESDEDISNAITERLQTTECQWIFVPLNSEQHWILVVINMRTMRCYWLDPLGSPDKYNIKPLINAGLKALQVDGKRRSNPIWYTVKCPKPSDNKQCGLYIMRYMKEIIDETPNPLLKKEPFTKLTYSKDEVDAVRLEWIQFVEKCM